MLALHAPRAAAPDKLTSLAGDAIIPQLIDPMPTVSESASSTLPRYWPTSSGTPFYQMASAPQGGVFTFCRGLPGSTQSGITYSEGRVMTASNAGARATLGQQWSFIHEGAKIELQVRSNPHGFLVRVDNKFLSLEPYQTSGQTIVTLDFGMLARRRIDLISWGMGFAGIFTDPTDSVFAATLRGPRAIIFGDSFTTPAPTNWATWFGHAMGWDDVWPSGVGGTGFVNDGNGNAVSLPDRVATDIVPYNPDLVFLHAGLNDFLVPPDEVEEGAFHTVRRIRDALPSTQVVGGADTAFGIEAWSAANLDTLDAIRTGIERGGGHWISPVELPLAFAGQPIGAEATLYAPVSAGQAGNDGTPDSVTHPNGFTCNTAVDNSLVNLRIGSVVEIGSGPNRERVAITSVGFHHARLVYGFDGAMQYDHVAGEPVREVGPCFVTGHGTSASPSGWGSADRFIGVDNFHYSPEGHRALGAVNAALLRQHLRGRPLI
ncbi:SGNH/GDSL hydrolase family protein [Parerythrobacter jejuensis]|nr:SGNH/GDSL hydrolase family protein [Parerythrobacter jejuensis]